MKELWKLECKDCGKRYEIPYDANVSKCLSCDSSNLARLVTVSDSGKGHEFLDLKCKVDSYPSRKKLRRHVQDGTKKGGDGRLINKIRIIYVDEDDYEELVVDYETGEILKKSKEPLSEHRNHGSAKGE